MNETESGDSSASSLLSREDAEKRASLVQLREQYLEAQKLVASDRPYSNLQWILGSRRNVTQDPLGLETQTIALVALWLQDLAIEMDRRLPRRPTGEIDPDSTSAAAREIAARTLRDATERFLLAFRPDGPDGAKDRVGLGGAVSATQNGRGAL